jgi:hypothetical protein
MKKTAKNCNRARRSASACAAWGAEVDARFLWPLGRWHCRRWPRRALALSALVLWVLVVRETVSINPTLM